MALQTPKPRTPARPSLAPAYQNKNTASSPNLSYAANTGTTRRTSLNALQAGYSSSPSSASGNMSITGGDGRDILLGDTVDVPGSMHGTVKFVGTVRGKKGIFAGVELSKQFAVRGKNDGDVDGTRYFTTSIPGSGIFLPIHRASKRSSSNPSEDNWPPTPPTPSLPNFGSTGPSPSKPLPKFSMSLGPGTPRPASPHFKPKQRPSLPRPESPFRKQPNLAPVSGRGPSLGPASFSRSQIGGTRFTPSPGPKVPPKSRTPRPSSRSYSRTGSRLGFVDDNLKNAASPALARSSDGSIAGSGTSAGSAITMQRTRPTDNEQDGLDGLRKKLDERDRQLKEQASSLADMESSLSELQSLIPDGAAHSRHHSGALAQGSDAGDLRATIREKNEKITLLTAEFDTHRADFRSTIDTLEMASTETARVYEQRVEELMQEVRELQGASQDVESVARQLKQLEDLVQELEEGLEDARRGEAEARGEVEFLRGEVERTRAELRREREKNAFAIKGGATSAEVPRDVRDLEQRDDEIRGLTAIIHSLSSGSASPEAERPALHRNGTISSTDVPDVQATLERLERENKDLQRALERKGHREDDMERELQRLREQRTSVLSNGHSDRTTTQDNRSSGRDSKGTVMKWRGSSGAMEGPPLNSNAEADTRSTTETMSSGVLWCEICETSGHDILTCDSIDGANGFSRNTTSGAEHMRTATHVHHASISSQDPDKPKPLSSFSKRTPASSPLPPSVSAPPKTPLPTPLDASVAAGKDGTRDPAKWCALCERDGHDSINCAFEDQFDD